MYAINVLYSLNRSFSTKVRTVFSSLQILRHNSYKPKNTISYTKRPETVKDVVLFEYENPKYFIIMNVASGIQCAFWTYLGIFLYQSFSGSNRDAKTQEFWSKIAEKNGKYSSLLSGIAFFFGWSMLFSTYLYSLRSVRKLILHKGGRKLTVITYNLLGHNKLEIPLSSVSSETPREKAKKYIPMKIKNKLFYYLMDVRGEFSNPELFDYTAGIKRNF